MTNLKLKFSTLVLLTFAALALSSQLYAQASRAWINGYFGYADPGQTPADKDASDLKRYAQGECRKLNRIPGDGTNKTFSDLCGELGKKCVKVLDWHKNELGCDNRADDGSRMALCVGDFASGHYAWHDTRTQQDREPELKQIAGNVYVRLYGQIGGDFNSVCKSIDLHCSHVKDWEDHDKNCSVHADDGSRSAYCLNVGMPPKCE